MSAVVDIEQHLVTPALVAACRAAPARSPGSALAAVYGPGRPAGLAESAAEAMVELGPRIAEMDASGVDVALLSVPLMPTYALDHEAATVALVPRLNDEMLSAARAHPGRFGAFAALPFPFVDACLDELERLAAEPLVRGVVAHAVIGEWALDDPALERVFQRISERRLPVLLHPAASFFGQVPSFRDWSFDSSIGAMAETSLVAARLILSGTLDRIPDLDLIVPHLGGLLPYLAQRIVDVSGSGDAEHDLAYYLRERLLLDSCSLHAPALACAVETVSAERILFASDYPYRGTLRRSIEDITESSLDDRAQRAVLSDNAARHALGLR